MKERQTTRPPLIGQFISVLLLLYITAVLSGYGKRAPVTATAIVTATINTTTAGTNTTRSNNYTECILPQPPLSPTNHTFTSRTPSTTHYCKAPDTKDPLSKLRTVNTWYSSKQRRAESVTLVTQLSLSRLDALRTQCTVWQDRLAAVIYVPLVNCNPYIDGLAADPEQESTTVTTSTLSDVVQQLAAFHREMDGHFKTCTLDLELVVETFNTTEDRYLHLYPFNHVRNKALQLSQTDIVFLLDADFIPSTSLFKEYSTVEGYRMLEDKLVKQKSAMIIPAFGTFTNSKQDTLFSIAAVYQDKQFLKDAVVGNIVEGFHLSRFRRGHGPTNFLRWNDTDRDYNIKYRAAYEPYILIARKYTPWYDETFRGYGFDKISQLETVGKLGTKFFVNPRHFVIHVPHPEAPTRAATQGSSQREKLRQLYAGVLKRLESKTYVPVTSFHDDPTLCRQIDGKQQNGMPYA